MNNSITFKTGTDNWNALRTSPSGLNLLTSGNGFLISKNEYDIWIAMLDKVGVPAAIHCYLYVQDNELSFLLVDSISDANENYILNETVFIQPFSIIPPVTNLNPAYIPEIEFSGTEYIARIMRWFFYAHLWHEIKTEGGASFNGPVRVFAIPFKDIRNLFELNEPLECVSVFMGLKEFGLDANSTDVELILCNEVASSDPLHGPVKEFFGDLTSPCPPFCGGDGQFNLL